MEPSRTGAQPHVAVPGVPGCDSDIASFYAGRSVLVTGASGFLGKLLVEKLLRSCPDLGDVFVLIRSKKGRSVQERVQDTLASRAFDLVRSQNRAVLAKVKAVAGDVSQPGLGLTAEDRAILVDAVSVVFHVAATVRFDEHLREAAAINIAGTEAVLDLCRAMPRLAALVHVSTAYTSYTRQMVHELVSPPPMSVDALKQELATKDDAAIEKDTERLIGGHPNTYTFTKAIAESLILEKGNGLPVVILRPSMVVPAMREPMPGWVDSWCGPVTPWVLIAKGMFTTSVGRPEYVADFVPVDVCINMMVAAAWDVHANTGKGGVPVYNCVSGATNPVTWGHSTDMWVQSARRRPLAASLAQPHFTFSANQTTFQLRILIGMLIPAYMKDSFVRLTTGKSPRLVAMIQKLCARLHTLEAFAVREFTFKADNAAALWSRMSATDRIMYPYNDLTLMDWGKYIDVVLEGAKTYLLRDGAVSNTPKDASVAPTKMLRTVKRLLPYLLGLALILISLLMKLQDFKQTLSGICGGDSIGSIYSCINLTPKTTINFS